MKPIKMKAIPENARYDESGFVLKVHSYLPGPMSLAMNGLAWSVLSHVGVQDGDKHVHSKWIVSTLEK